MRIFFLVLSSLILVIAETGRTQAKPKPIVVGHRGASGYKPEHTLASYELAIDQGADFIEPDLVATKDGILIARHENEISGTSDVALKFPDRKFAKEIDGQKIEGWFTEDFTLSEIKTLRAKERLEFRGHKEDFKHEIPTFEEVVNLVLRKSKEKKRVIGIIPEIKHPTYFKKINLDLVPLLVRDLKRLGLDDKNKEVVIQSFELSPLEELKTLTKVRLLYLVDDPNIRPADFVVRNDARKYGDMLKIENLKAIAATAWGLGPAKAHLMKDDGSSTGVLENAHAAGLKVIPYTFRQESQFVLKAAAGDPQKEYKLFYALGVDGLFSDFPDQAIKARGGKK